MWMVCARVVVWSADIVPQDGLHVRDIGGDVVRKFG